MHKIFGWNVVCSGDFSDRKELLEAITGHQYQVDQIYRDNWRTLSARIVFSGTMLVLKVPRARNNRLWERFLTLFRGSDSVRHFRQLELMSELGMSAPKPVLAGEKRHFGMVTDSFVCYEFVVGESPKPSASEAVMNSLRTLHGKGYLRTDAQLANFVVDENKRVVFIDFRLKRPRIFVRLQKARELDRFVRSCPEAAVHLTANERGSFWLRLAHALENFSFAVRKSKRKMRRRKRKSRGC